MFYASPYAVTIVNMLVQLIITQICWAQGNIKLQYNCRMEFDQYGGMKLRFAGEDEDFILVDDGCDEIMQQFITGLD